MQILFLQNSDDIFLFSWSSNLCFMLKCNVLILNLSIVIAGTVYNKIFRNITYFLFAISAFCVGIQNRTEQDKTEQNRTVFRLSAWTAQISSTSTSPPIARCTIIVLLRLGSPVKGYMWFIDCSVRCSGAMQYTCHDLHPNPLHPTPLPTSFFCMPSFLDFKPQDVTSLRLEWVNCLRLGSS